MRRRRADAEQNYGRIVEAAARLLERQADVAMDDVAAEAGLGRATVYRHFRTRRDLLDVVRRQTRGEAESNGGPAVDAPPGPAGGPLDVADVLNKVPPHLLGEQIVAEAQRLAGVSSVALYLIDIDGSHLLRLAGSAEFPVRLRAPLAVGPEIPPEGLPDLRRSIEAELPGTAVVSLFLRGRCIAVLLALATPEGPLLELARQAGPALALADVYSDVFDSTRRRRATSAATEVQQDLLPPRIARVAGGAIAGNVLPGYDVGGDWFDYVENPEGTWLAVADPVGRGARAAGHAAIALGAFRAGRRSEASLAEAVAGMHREIATSLADSYFVKAVVGRWHGPSATFTWITCGNQPPLLIDADGRVAELDTPTNLPLGLYELDRPFQAGSVRLEPGQRVVLLTDGVTSCRMSDSTAFGVQGVQAAVAGAGRTAPATVQAILGAVVGAARSPLDDDATCLVFARGGAS